MRPTSVSETSFWLMCSNAVSSLWPRSRQTCCLNAISPRAICDPNEGVKSSTNILPSVWAVGSGQCTCVPPPHRCSVDCAHKRGPLRFAPGAHFILIILFFGSSQFLVIASMNHNSCGSVYGFCGPRAGFASVHAGKKKKGREGGSEICGLWTFLFLFSNSDSSETFWLFSSNSLYFIVPSSLTIFPFLHALKLLQRIPLQTSFDCEDGVLWVLYLSLP